MLYTSIHDSNVSYETMHSNVKHYKCKIKRKCYKTLVSAYYETSMLYNYVGYETSMYNSNINHESLYALKSKTKEKYYESLVFHSPLAMKHQFFIAISTIFLKKNSYESLMFHSLSAIKH